MLPTYSQTKKFENDIDCLMNLDDNNVTTRTIGDINNFSFLNFDLLYGLKFNQQPQGEYIFQILIPIGLPINIPVHYQKINNEWYGFINKNQIPLFRSGFGFKNIFLKMKNTDNEITFEYIVGYLPTNKKQHLVFGDYELESLGLKIIDDLGIC